MEPFNEELIRRTSKERIKWPDFSGLKKFFGGAMELNPEELMSAYDGWSKNWAQNGQNSPDEFLRWLTAPHGFSRKFEKKAKPAPGAAERFKMRFNVRDDVGKAQMQLRSVRE